MPGKIRTLALVAAEFNRPVIDAMITAATNEALELGARVTHTVKVPGCYEIPLVVGKLLARPEIEAVIVLGYIERGDTQHGEVMGHVVHAALMDISLTQEKPLGLGIIGPGATHEQAERRVDGYARAAVRAACASLGALEDLGS